MKIRITFTEGVLGTASADPELHEKFIASMSKPERVPYSREDHVRRGFFLHYCEVCGKFFQEGKDIIYVGDNGRVCGICWDNPKIDTDGWMRALNTPRGED